MDNIRKYFLENPRFEKILTSKEAALIDRFTVDSLKIDQKLLMENAGKSVADFIVSMLPCDDANKTNIIIFAGPGSNGADALVAARHLLLQNFTITIFLALKKYGNAVLEQMTMLNRIGEEKKHSLVVKAWTEDDALTKIEKTTIFVDGIFGAGLNRAPTDVPLKIIRSINELRRDHARFCKVVSIDVPSGLSLEANTPLGECVRADHTITFDFLKRAHISEPSKIFCGQSHAKNIGLFQNSEVKNFFVYEQTALSLLFLPVKKNCHKGIFGHVLVYEGHARFLGASRICARAALRAGVGLTTIISASGIPLAYDLPEFMHQKKSDLEEDFLKKIDVLVVGPGLSKDLAIFDEALSFVNKLKNHVPCLVIDADGLKMLLDPRLRIKEKNMIATPHAKEAGDLLGLSPQDIEQDRFLAIEKLGALKCNNNNRIIWILKGATTLVRSLTGEIFAFRGDLPILSIGGSGDMLAGLIAGLIKQTADPLHAALLAVSLQIEAGAQSSAKIFKGSLVSELCDIIPRLTKLRKIIDHAD